MTAKNKHVGSSFNDFLEKEGIRDDVELLAIKKRFALRLHAAMKAMALTKVRLAKELHTSRTQIDRLLDPDDTSITLATMVRASKAVGLDLLVTLEKKSKLPTRLRTKR